MARNLQSYGELCLLFGCMRKTILKTGAVLESMLGISVDQVDLSISDRRGNGVGIWARSAL